MGRIPSRPLDMTRSQLSLFDLAPGKVLLDRYLIDAPHRENGMSAAFRVTDQAEDAEREEAKTA